MSVWVDGYTCFYMSSFHTSVFVTNVVVSCPCQFVYEFALRLPSLVTFRWCTLCPFISTQVEKTWYFWLVLFLVRFSLPLFIKYCVYCQLQTLHFPKTVILFIGLYFYLLWLCVSRILITIISGQWIVVFSFFTFYNVIWKKLDSLPVYKFSTFNYDHSHISSIDHVRTWCKDLG